MVRRARFSVGIVLCAVGIAGKIAVAAPSARLFRSPPYRVAAVDPPTGWELAASPQSSRLLASWAHRDGGRLTLAAEKSAELDASRLLDQSRNALVAQGWTLGHIDKQPGRVTVEATLDHGKRMARQLYAIEQGFAYVLTLVAPADQAQERVHDFEETIGSMRLGAADSH